MFYSENAMSAILLCSYLGINKDDLLKPFSLGEWNSFLDKLIEIKEEPSVIFKTERDWIEKMNYSREQKERINHLVLRGANVAFELESLEKKGIQVVTLFDSNYPILLKRKLKRKAPPILFYAGNLELAKKIGIAVVGSRNVDDEGIEFTKKLVEKASKEKLIVYSGGARGVDTVSESIALNSGGAVVSFIADSLLSKIKKQDVINNIISGKLLLFSDVKPDMGFSAARAMNRNKYIYASAYGAFVVASDDSKGGTWTGAIESINNNFTKTLIWNNKKYEGNVKLIEKGGVPYEITEESIYSVITKKQETFEQLDLFGNNLCFNNVKKESEVNNVFHKNDIYNMVKTFLVKHMETGKSLEEIASNFNILDSQMQIWLDSMCQENLVVFDNGVYQKCRN